MLRSFGVSGEIRREIGHAGMLVVELVRSIWSWRATQALHWVTSYATCSGTGPYGIPYDGFISEGSTEQNFSTPSSPQLSPRGRKLG